MAEFKVAEIFSSVNGEGTRSGQLALFIRMCGCNLQCGYCDTKWANEPDAEFQWMSTQEILSVIRTSGIRNVTLTGGEPLIQKGIEELLAALEAEPWIRVEIETNGSVPLEQLMAKVDPVKVDAPEGAVTVDSFGGRKRISFNMDYKLPGSGMQHLMHLGNLDVLTADDTVKFVVRDRKDLASAQGLIGDHDLTERCRVFLSPVYGEIEPEEIVNFMKEHHMNDVTLQLQIHKIIWDSSRSGV